MGVHGQGSEEAGKGRGVNAERPRQIAWDDDAWWPDTPALGSAVYVSEHTPDAVPHLLVPDEHGGYREHVAQPRPKRKLGF